MAADAQCRTVCAERSAKHKMPDQPLLLHYERSASVHGAVDSVFAFLDHPKALASHMSRSSLMMAGSHMAVEVDADGGSSVGSLICMSGSMMGISLDLKEIVTLHRAPYQKILETIGTPNLKVIAHYRMGFELTPRGDSPELYVSIDYRLPASGPGTWFYRLIGGIYTRWCVKRMVDDAVKAFQPAHQSAT